MTNKQQQMVVDSVIEFCQKQMENDSSIHKGVYLSIIKFCQEQITEESEIHWKTTLVTAKPMEMASNKQQTVVEWLHQEMLKPNLSMKEILEQAKEIDKEQKEKLSASWAKSREQTREAAMHIGFTRGFMSGIDCYEDYYEELNRTQLDEDEFTRNYITDRFEETNGENKL
jgi:hypothetical protein